MKHKKYPSLYGKNAKTLADEVAHFVQSRCNLDVRQWEKDGTIFVVPITKHDIAQRLIGQDKSFGVYITEENGIIDVAIGMASWVSRAALVAGSTVVPVAVPVAAYAALKGAKAQKDIINAVWKHIDAYMQ